MKKRGRKPLEDQIGVMLRRSFARSRCQARFRGQQWDITFEQYRALWEENNNYLRKGRTNEKLCFCRKDISKGWTLNNVEIENNFIVKHRNTKQAWSTKNETK